MCEPRTAARASRVSFATTGDRRFVSADGRTTYGLVFLADQRFLDTAYHGTQLTAELAGALSAGWSVLVTGIEGLQAGNNQARDSDVLVPTLVRALGAFLVLAFVFGSLLALVPLLIAAVSARVGQRCNRPDHQG